MLMLVIGALLIAYLVYFAATTLRLGSRRRAMHRDGADMAGQPDPKSIADLQRFDPDGKDVARLEARIAVLERIIAEDPPSSAAEQTKSDPPAGRDGQQG